MLLPRPLARTMGALTLFVVACVLVVTVQAGIRGPGKYSGIVIFDRWDTCFLLSGAYITYISNSAKNELRPYEGRAMQIDATEVLQPINPGDGLVKQYKVLGPAPDSDHVMILNGLEFVLTSDLDASGSPAFQLAIRNTGEMPVEVRGDEIALTLLGSNRNMPFRASDGASVAWITRTYLLNGSSSDREIDGENTSTSYSLDPENTLPRRFEVMPGESRSTRILFRLPLGEYQLIFGYGGDVHEGKSLASNALSFDVNHAGIATIVR